MFVNCFFFIFSCGFLVFCFCIVRCTFGGWLVGCVFFVGCVWLFGWGWGCGWWCLLWGGSGWCCCVLLCWRVWWLCFFSWSCVYVGLCGLFGGRLVGGLVMGSCGSWRWLVCSLWRLCWICGWRVCVGVFFWVGVLLGWLCLLCGCAGSVEVCVWGWLLLVFLLLVYCSCRLLLCLFCCFDCYLFMVRFWCLWCSVWWWCLCLVIVVVIVFLWWLCLCSCGCVGNGWWLRVGSWCLVGGRCGSRVFVCLLWGWWSLGFGGWSCCDFGVRCVRLVGSWVRWWIVVMVFYCGLYWVILCVDWILSWWCGWRFCSMRRSCGGWWVDSFLVSFGRCVWRGFLLFCFCVWGLCWICLFWLFIVGWLFWRLCWGGWRRFYWGWRGGSCGFLCFLLLYCVGIVWVFVLILFLLCWVRVCLLCRLWSLVGVDCVGVGCCWCVGLCLFVGCFLVWGWGFVVPADFVYWIVFSAGSFVFILLVVCGFLCCCVCFLLVFGGSGSGFLSCCC